MFATRIQIKILGRLQKRSDFLHARTKGRKWVARNLILQIVENDAGQIRYGLTVSKRVDKSAVRRNRIRRRLRAVACDVLSDCARPGYDYVLIGRAETAHSPYTELVSDLKWSLKRLDCRTDQEDRHDPKN